MKQEKPLELIELENEKLRSRLKELDEKIKQIEKENEDIHDYVRDLQGQLRVFRGY